MFCCCVAEDDRASQVDMKHTLASDEAAPKKEEGAAAGAAPSAKGAEGVKAAAAAPAFGAFEVVVKTNKSNLGIELDKTASKVKGGAMVKVIKSGAVKQFNELNPDQAIQVYDEITSLDEVTGTKEIEKKMSSKLPEEDFGSKSTGVVVEELMSDGLMAKWNVGKSDEEQVKGGDRIIECNGQEGLLDNMRSPASSIVLGRPPEVGTGMVNLLVDLDPPEPASKKQRQFKF
eukprot:g6810.t1